VVANNQGLQSTQVEQEKEAKRWQERWNNVLQMNEGLLESNRKLGEQMKEADNKLVEEVKLWEEEYEGMRALLEKMFDLHQIATENEEQTKRQLEKTHNSNLTLRRHHIKVHARYAEDTRDLRMEL